MKDSPRYVEILFSQIYFVYINCRKFACINIHNNVYNINFISIMSAEEFIDIETQDLNLKNTKFNLV